MTRHFVHNWLFTLAVALAAGAFACGGSSENPAGPTAGPTTSSGPGNPGGPGSPGVPSPSGKGRLTLAMTDGPFSDADAVLVTFSDVTVHSAEEGWQPFPLATTPRVCDLKKLEGPVDLLGEGSLNAGHYTQIRIKVDQADIYFESGESTGDPCEAVAPTAINDDPYHLQISSGDIKLNRQFTLDTAGHVTIVLDFDGDKSIHQTGGGNGNGKVKYIMNPVIGIRSVTTTTE